jgi:hypothetical protein
VLENIKERGKSGKKTKRKISMQEKEIGSFFFRDPYKVEMMLKEDFGHCPPVFRPHFGSVFFFFFS